MTRFWLERFNMLISSGLNFCFKGKLSPAKIFQNIPYKALYLPKYKNVLSVFLWGCPNIFKLTLELHYSGRHCSTALFMVCLGHYIM